MDYDVIKQIRRNERAHRRLTKISNNFYREVSDYFKELDTEDMQHLDFRYYNNCRNSYKEILERRLHKITQKAYFDVLNRLSPLTENNTSSEYPSNIIGCEKELYDNIVSSYEKFYDERNKEYKE